VSAFVLPEGMLELGDEIARGSFGAVHEAFLYGMRVCAKVRSSSPAWCCCSCSVVWRRARGRGRGRGGVPSPRPVSVFVCWCHWASCSARRACAKCVRGGALCNPICGLRCF
jgi:hypothetical protein